MANPQKEDGYTAIANEIMDALISANLSGHELRLSLLIMRKTYGYNKCEDSIALSQMERATGLGKIRCSQVINRLQLMKIVTVTENINGIGKKYKFNKDFETWDTVTEKCNSYRKVKSTVTEKRNRPLQKTDTTKDKVQKTLLQKTFSSSEIQFQLADLLLREIRKRNPNHKEPNLQTWARDIDLMIRRDKRDPPTIRAVIEWCQKDSFWQNNILSPGKLREKFDQLNMKMRSNGNGKSDSRGPGAAGEKAGRAKSDGAEYPTDYEFS